MGLVKLAEKILDLLDRNVQDPVCVEFLQSMKTHDLNIDINTSFQREGCSIGNYLIKNKGFALLANDEIFWEARFILAPDIAHAKPFSDELPFSLPSPAYRKDVYEHLGKPFRVTTNTVSQRSVCESFQGDSFKISCWFSNSEEKLTKIGVFFFPKD